MLEFSIYDFINTKKQGASHDSLEISWFINHLNNFEESQISAWLMAVYLNGLNIGETTELTRAMAYSGHVLTLKRHEEDIIGTKNINRGFIDKHSTGGVGDKTTLILSPLLASLGFKVSKFSGKALGQTGGTIDKLESIPGFTTDINIKQFEKQIKNIGIALASQNQNFAPADKLIYKIRDKTSTVDSIPLIASSILSKKMAGGADVIMLDIKCGSGAFMSDIKSAKKLKKCLEAVAKSLKLELKVIISNMNQPLGFTIGNALEVAEARDILSGKVKNDTYNLVLELASLVTSKEQAAENIANGKAYVTFCDWIEAQNGDLSSIEHIEDSKAKISYAAAQDAYIQSINTYKLGLLINRLNFSSEKFDYSAGLKLNYKIGDSVKPGDIIFEIQGNDKEVLKTFLPEVSDCFCFSKHQQKKPKLILS